MGGQRGRHLPGRSARLEGFPAQSTRLGPRSLAVGLSELLAGLQHRPPHPRQPGPTAQAQGEPRGQPVLDVRLRSRPLRVDEPWGSPRSAGCPGVRSRRGDGLVGGARGAEDPAAGRIGRREGGRVTVLVERGHRRRRRPDGRPRGRRDGLPLPASGG